MAFKMYNSNYSARSLAFVVFFVCVLFSHAQMPAYVPLSGLQAFWPFSGNANDISGNSYNGSVSGATLTFDRFGSPASAYSFNGTSDYISTNYSGILGSGARAVSFWAKTTNSGNSMAAVAWGGNLQASRFYCGLNFLSPGVTIDGAYGALTYSPVAPAHDNQWHHYVFQFSNPGLAQVAIYQDGVLLTQLIQSYNPSNILNTLPTFNVHFGRIIYPPSPDFFNGHLDEIGIWNRTLSICEIQALYTSSVSLNLNITSTNTLICAGGSATLSATGGQSYQWSNNLSGSVIVVAPVTTTNYVVTSTTPQGCSASRTITLVVDPAITHVTSSKTLVCAGEPVVLGATGAITYSWSNAATGPIVLTNPTTTTVYSVTGTSTLGCLSTASIAVSVEQCKTVNKINAVEVLSVSPNPIENASFSIKCNCEKLEFDIYGSGGQLISSGIIAHNYETINTESWPRGIYTLVVKTIDGLSVYKVVK